MWRLDNFSNTDLMYSCTEHEARWETEEDAESGTINLHRLRKETGVPLNLPIIDPILLGL
jgi:hypothetical protein